MQALLNHKQAKKINKGKRQTLHNPSISDDNHQAQYFSIVDSHGVNININQFAAASPKKPKPKPEIAKKKVIKKSQQVIRQESYIERLV